MDEGWNFKTGSLDLHQGELQAVVLPADVSARCQNVSFSLSETHTFTILIYDQISLYFSANL